MFHFDDFLFMDSVLWLTQLRSLLESVFHFLSRLGARVGTEVPQVPPVLLVIHLRHAVHPSCSVDPCNTVVFPTETVKAFYDIWRLQYLAVEPWSSHFHYLCLSFSIWLDNRSSKIIVKMGSSLYKLLGSHLMPFICQYEQCSFSYF